MRGRRMTQKLLLDLGGYLPVNHRFYDEAGTGLRLGTPAWATWLADPRHTVFRVLTPHGSYSAERERRRGHVGW